MCDQKTIVINDKHSYDILNVKKEDRIRIGSDTIEFDHQQTKSLLMLDDIKCMKAIYRKILGYKNQDNKKHIYDVKTIISLQEAKEKLIDCNLKCQYCRKEVKVIYRIVRDPLQWTLDRIDNKKNHSKVNTLISCLSCNLKRRNINKEKFEFSKNITIVKSK
jgi:hypothetical protein